MSVTIIMPLAIVGLALALGQRSRLFALPLLLIGVVFFGVFSARVTRSQPSAKAVMHSASGPMIMQEHNWSQRQSLERAQAQMQNEIRKNQRLAARMTDATVQESPDGSALETYPDGMQIRQFGMSRTIVRPADAPAWTHGSNSGYVTGRLATWVLIVPIIVLVAMFLVLRARRRHHTGAGLAWALVGGGALMLLLLAGLGYRSVGYPPAMTRPIPVPNTAYLIDEPNVTEFASAPPAPVQPSTPPAIEALWAQLTAPKIKLDEPPAGPSTQAQRELVAAAKLVLTASLPGADPFTQGWVSNAAKAILDASAKTKPQLPNFARSTKVPGGPAEAHKTTPATPQWPLAATDSKPSAKPQSGGKPKAQPVAMAPKTSGNKRPEWLDNPPNLVDVGQVVVSTDAYSTVDECYEALRQKLRELVRQRIQEKAQEANNGAPVYVPEVENMQIGVEYILSELCRENVYIESVSTSVGEMKKAHALVEFTPQQDEYLLDRWRSFARRESVHVVTIASSLVFAGLAFVYGLLKVDTLTRGYYTKRLFLGVPAAIIAVVAAIAALG